MTLDQRGAKAAEALDRHLAGQRVSTGDLRDRQARRQRRRLRGALALFVVLVVVAAPVVLLTRSADDDRGRANPGGDGLPLGTLTSGAWSSVPVGTSGLGDGSEVSAMASTVDGIVAVGSRPTDGADVRAVWFSEDGLTWNAASTPDGGGRLTAVGADGDSVLAVGTSASTGGPADSVWRSADGGRTWKVLAASTDLFGAAAPSGRPFVTSILRLDGRWLAVGGAADGTGETWVSDDGRSWTPTFPEDRTGGPEVARRSDGSLLAYWVDPVWTSDDGVTWSERRPSRPAGIDLRAVADGAAVAAGYERSGPYTSPTPLLRSTDDGLTWTTDPSFLAAAPDATGWVVEVVGDTVVVGGSENGSARPAAWASTGADSWVGLPAALTEGQEGGGMRLVASVGSTIVMIAGGPVAVTPGGAAPPAPSRFFVLRTDQVEASGPRGGG